MLEAYAAGWDYNDMMDFTEGLFEAVALDLFGDTKVRLTPEGEATAIVIDLKAPWKRMTMKEAIKTYGHLDVDNMTDARDARPPSQRDPHRSERCPSRPARSSHRDAL